MAKPDRGTKRQCPHCSAKFYDLNKVPIVCPVCGKEYLLTVQKAAPAEPEAKKEPETVEVEVDEAAVAVGAEVVSLDDAEDDDDDTGEEIPDVEGVEDVEDIGGDDEDTFLEEDEDDGNIEFNVSEDD